MILNYCALFEFLITIILRGFLTFITESKRCKSNTARQVSGSARTGVFGDDVSDLVHEETIIHFN